MRILVTPLDRNCKLARVEMLRAAVVLTEEGSLVLLAFAVRLR
jgi:hypothetical protein